MSLPSFFNFQNRKVFFVTILRIALGLLWGILAISLWSSDFASHLHRYHGIVFRSQPGLLMPWFGIWAAITSIAPDFLLIASRIVTTVIAVCLLLGLARKLTYVLGLLACLPLWALTEGYFSAGSLGGFNLSFALLYLLLFTALLMAERRHIPSACSVDVWVAAKWPAWRRFDNSTTAPGKAPLRRDQLSLLALSAAILAFFISAAANSLNLGHSTSPSPLRIGSSAPIQTPNTALLPPVPEGDEVNIHIEAAHRTVEISSGVFYQAWTFNGSSPAPTIRARQGQTVNVTFTNINTMPHSIDFHSAMIAPNRAFASANYGETIKFSFVAKVPGAFVYHCGTPPVLLHQGNGMYGAVIIDPAEPLPPADFNYVLVQGEWYTQRVTGTTMMSDYEKMVTNKPDLVTFNGIAFQYEDHPLKVKPGKRVRIYFVNAGPNLWSSFHVIGGIFDRVYPDGDASHALSGVSAYSVGPGQGYVFDIIFPEPGSYAFVDHSMKNMAVGAMGYFEVE